MVTKPFMLVLSSTYKLLCKLVLPLTTVVDNKLLPVTFKLPITLASVLILAEPFIVVFEFNVVIPPTVKPECIVTKPFILVLSSTYKLLCKLVLPVTFKLPITFAFPLIYALFNDVTPDTFNLD